MIPKVKLISYTPDAENLLLYTKFTRLSTDNQDAMDIIKSWSEERKRAELQYMLGTIESSWEFVVFTFSISGVGRGFTHQIVRTRAEENPYNASFAQQSQRTVNMQGFGYVTPSAFTSEQKEKYDQTMESINNGYNDLIELGAAPQDARGVLPTNVETSIIVKFDLRTLSHMMQERLCTRTQGEFQEVAKLMKEEILKVYPWCEDFLQCYCCKVGTCRFPNYNQCPIKGMMFNPRTGLTYDKERDYQPVRNIDTRKHMEGGKVVDKPATIYEIKAAWNQLQEEGGYEARPKMQEK